MQNENGPQNIDDVKHPSAEEWMEWLYDESSSTEKTRLAAHLKQCSQCRAEVQRWEQTQAALDIGKMEIARPRSHVGAPWLKWGIAAAFLLVAGFSVGRGMAPSETQVRTIRASLKAELSAEVAQQIVDYKKSADQKSAQDNKLILDALAKTDTDRLADYAELHKELETVAVLTQNTFQQTQQQIVTLANYSQPETKNQ
jgi:hypothetical protein